MKLLFYVLFVGLNCKHDKMAFLTSRNVSKHVLLALVSIVQPVKFTVIPI